MWNISMYLFFIFYFFLEKKVYERLTYKTWTGCLHTIPLFHADESQGFGAMYVYPWKCSPAVGVAAGESSGGIVVQHLSKFAVQSFPLTSGLNFGCNSLASNFFQLIDRNHLWLLISSPPPGPLPNLLDGSFCSNWNNGRNFHLFVTVLKRKERSKMFERVNRILYLPLWAKSELQSSGMVEAWLSLL